MMSTVLAVSMLMAMMPVVYWFVADCYEAHQRNKDKLRRMESK